MVWLPHWPFEGISLQSDCMAYCKNWGGFSTHQVSLLLGRESRKMEKGFDNREGQCWGRKGQRQTYGCLENDCGRINTSCSQNKGSLQKRVGNEVRQPVEGQTVKDVIQGAVLKEPRELPVQEGKETCHNQLGPGGFEQSEMHAEGNRGKELPYDYSQVTPGQTVFCLLNAQCMLFLYSIILLQKWQPHLAHQW